MPSTGWYNENENRTFPFEHRTTGVLGGSGMQALPHGVICDAGFFMGARAGWLASDTVRLHKITRVGTTFLFEFRASAYGCHDRSLTFSRDLTDPQYQVEFLDVEEAPYGYSESADWRASGSSGISESNDVCPVEPLWGGFLVTGKMSVIAELLPSDGELVGDSTSAVVEPSLVQSLGSSYVETVNLGNQDRTRTTAPLDCSEPLWEFPTGEDIIYSGRGCMHGALVFSAGYNATVRADVFENAIILGAAVGSGAGEPPNVVPVFVGETPPVGGDLLEGGDCCNGIIRTVNGVGGRFAQLLGGLGVDITVVPSQHRIIVDVNLNQLAACLETGSSESI